METYLLNDEEQAIISDLKGLPEPEVIAILEDSLADEPSESGRRVLGSLILKLKQGRGEGRG